MVTLLKGLCYKSELLYTKVQIIIIIIIDHFKKLRAFFSHFILSVQLQLISAFLFLQVTLFLQVLLSFFGKSLSFLHYRKPPEQLLLELNNIVTSCVQIAQFLVVLSPSFRIYNIPSSGPQNNCFLFNEVARIYCSILFCKNIYKSNIKQL